MHLPAARRCRATTYHAAPPEPCMHLHRLARPRRVPGTLATTPACSVQHLANGAREGDDVADVAHGGRVQHEALEADAEARVGLRAEAARVQVRRVVLLLQAEVLHAREEHIEALLAL